MKKLDQSVWQIIEFSETLSDRYAKPGSPLTASDHERLRLAIKSVVSRNLLKKRIKVVDASQLCDSLSRVLRL